MKKFEVEVCSSSEYTEVPSYATIKVDTRLKKRILELAEAVKKLDASCIMDYDTTPEWYVQDDNDKLTPWTCNGELGRTELERLVVYRDDFYWEAVVKHTETRFETNLIPIKNLK